jgi:hypothetical protein
MGLLVITMGPKAEARGMKNSPGPKPTKKEAVMAEVLIPLENISLPDGEEMTEPSVGDMVELTGEVMEIRDGKAVVRVTEAETEEAETEAEPTEEPTLEEEGAALRQLAEQEDAEA